MSHRVRKTLATRRGGRTMMNVRPIPPFQGAGTFAVSLELEHRSMIFCL